MLQVMPLKMILLTVLLKVDLLICMCKAVHTNINNSD